jgi:hypothetical protein
MKLPTETWIAEDPMPASQANTRITRHVPLSELLSVFDIVKNGEAIKVTVEP